MFASIGQWFEQWAVNDYMNVIGRIIKIALIWVVASLLIRIGNFIIKSFFNRQSHSRIHVDKQKNDTLKALLKSILRYAIYFIAIIMILEELGINTASLIATAGIGGLAIGFGAQNLVKDVITGFFIIFEDQYGVGDYVSIGDIFGTVEEIGLRITKIRGFKGDINIIPNGQISTVTNFSRGNSAAVIEISIAYHTDIDEAVRVAERVCQEYGEGNPDIAEGPQVVGITDMDDVGMTFRVMARTLPMKHWAVERELRRAIKEAFDDNNIEIPYPRMVVLEEDRKS